MWAIMRGSHAARHSKGSTQNVAEPPATCMFSSAGVSASSTARAAPSCHKNTQSSLSMLSSLQALRYNPFNLLSGCLQVSVVCRSVAAKAPEGKRHARRKCSVSTSLRSSKPMAAMRLRLTWAFTSTSVFRETCREMGGGPAEASGPPCTASSSSGARKETWRSVALGRGWWKEAACVTMSS